MAYVLLNENAYQKYQNVLSGFGFDPIALPRDSRLNQTVAAHADTLIFSDGSMHIVNREYAAFLPGEVHYFMTETDEYLHGNYPNDTAFNALRIGHYLFARRSSLSAAVRNYADESGLSLVNVNQGYARCSVLPLTSARAAITADEGMAKAMEGVGIEVLRISAGHIALEGCAYGFIGGASFVWEPRNCCSVSRFGRYVYFFGSLRYHPDGERISDFIRSHGYEIISLEGELTDFGGAITVE